MKYTDSIVKADQKLTESIKQLRLWNLPASPLNYAVSYEYISKQNQSLNEAIKQQIACAKPIDTFFIKEAYQLYIASQSALRDEVITEMEDVLTCVEKNNKHSSKSLNNFVRTLDGNIQEIQSPDKSKQHAAILKLRKASNHLQKQQALLTKQLETTKQQTVQLKAELAFAKKDVYLDPLTSFYNRKAMSKHLDAWMLEDPNKSLAAIVINVDHFSQFSQKFGPLIGDVLLSKIANKVGSYVDDSGLPIRSAGDEFIILLPDIEKNIANEIAFKIRQGVEKLRFVSSKSGVRLPQMTVSVGVSQFKATEAPNTIIKKARQFLNLSSHNNNLALN